MLNSSRLERYVNWVVLVMLQIFPSKIYFSQQYMHLRIVDNIITNKRYQVKFYRTRIEKKRGLMMMMILPYRFICTHDLHDGLVRWKILCEIV